MAFSKSLGIDPREGYADPKLDHLYQPAAIPVISRSNIGSECIWERRDRLNAEAAKREEHRHQRASQQVQDVLADRLHQRPLAKTSPSSRPVPPWRKEQEAAVGSDARPSWAQPKPTIRMPRSMEVKPFQGQGLPQWSSFGDYRSVSQASPRESGMAKTDVCKEESSSGRMDIQSSGNMPGEESASPEVEDSNPTLDTSRHEVRQLISGEVELDAMPEELRADRDIVAAALHADGHALQHASNDLKSDRPLVLAAVRENGLALSHAAKELCGDQDVVLTAVRQNGLALQHASSDLRASAFVVLEALAQNSQSARFVARELLDDRSFVISAAPFSRRIFEKASFRLKRNLDVVLEVVEHDPDSFMFAAWELRCDKFSVKQVVSTAGCAIAHASPDLRQDPEILAVAVANDPLAVAAAKV